MDSIVAANPSVPGLALNWRVLRPYLPAELPLSSAPIPKSAASTSVPRSAASPTDIPGHVYLIAYNDSRPLKHAVQVVLKTLTDRRVSVTAVRGVPARQFTSEDTVVFFVYFSTPRSMLAEDWSEFLKRARGDARDIFLVRVTGLSQIADADSYSLPSGHVIDATYHAWHTSDEDISADLVAGRLGEKVAAALAHVQRLGAPLCAAGCGKPATQHNCGRTALVCSEVCCSALQDD